MERPRKTGIGYQHVKIFSFGNALKIDLFEGKHRRAKIMIIGHCRKRRTIADTQAVYAGISQGGTKAFCNDKTKSTERKHGHTCGQGRES